MNTACTLQQNKTALKAEKPLVQLLKNWLVTIIIPGAEHMSKTK